MKEQFNIKKYLNENKITTGLHKKPLIKEGKMVQSLKKHIAMVKKGGGNEMNLENWMSNVSDLDSEIKRANSGEGQPGWITDKTIKAFENFLKAWTEDETAAERVQYFD
jgi:hypothetical protein